MSNIESNYNTTDREFVIYPDPADPMSGFFGGSSLISRAELGLEFMMNALRLVEGSLPACSARKLSEELVFLLLG
jgi:hypothetical protein